MVIIALLQIILGALSLFNEQAPEKKDISIQPWSENSCELSVYKSAFTLKWMNVRKGEWAEEDKVEDNKREGICREAS